MGESDDSTPVRPSWDEYSRWLIDKTGQEVVTTARARFELVSQKIRSDIEASAFWTKVVSAFSEINDEYTSRYRYKLFVTPDLPIIVVKPYQSLLEKTYRKNILSNHNWPSPPDEDWITPLNWYGRINDIARTTVVVKYLDGVEFFVERAQGFAEQYGHSFRVDYEANTRDFRCFGLSGV